MAQPGDEDLREWKFAGEKEVWILVTTKNKNGKEDGPEEVKKMNIIILSIAD